jgi:bifunctional non-homologous end joining protein LigD
MAERKSAAQRLAAYQAKRNFSKTPEPSGAAGGEEKAADTAPEGRFFCVQKHLASHLHYDFRLEHAGVLLSWAVPKGPSLNTKDKRLAMRTEDHPFDYGEFEGVIPEGYGAGIVMLWDKGTWEPEPGCEDIDAALAKGELKFRLDGVKLKGGWVMVRTGGRGGASGDGRGDRAWLLIKHRDEWAGALDVAAKFPLSIKSFGDFEDILAQDKPDVWESHRPAQGGDAGAMFAEIIEKAAKIKAGRGAKSAKPRAAGGAAGRSAASAGSKKLPARSGAAGARRKSPAPAAAGAGKKKSPARAMGKRKKPSARGMATRKKPSARAATGARKK